MSTNKNIVMITLDKTKSILQLAELLFDQHLYLYETHVLSSFHLDDCTTIKYLDLERYKNYYKQADIITIHLPKEYSKSWKLIIKSYFETLDSSLLPNIEFVSYSKLIL